MDRMKNMVNDIKSGWEKIDKKKRIGLVVGVVVTTILLFLVLFFAQRTEYKVLFSELEESDAGAIVEDIESKGMEYKLEDGGTTILIDESEVDNYRIELAVNGPMPSTSTGFEIFDSGSMMATDEDRAIMYQRAISGELERAITAIDNVEEAKVLLNIPESSVFQNPDYQKEASASIVLEMNGSQMPGGTTQGITALVSGAVENLPQENVEVLDTNGRLLSAGVGDGNNLGSDVVTEHQRIKNSVEANLEEQVVTLLAPIYGLENVQITVNTDLNFDAIEREAIEYGDEGSVRSQTESVTGSEALANQVQGSLLEEDFVTEFEEGEGNENSTYDHSTNYELDTTTSRIVEAPGAIERMTASVIITNNNAPGNNVDLENVIMNALGMDLARDTEENQNYSPLQIEFINTGAEEEEPAVIGGPGFLEALMDWVTTNWWVILIGVVLLLLLIILMRVLKRRAEEKEYEEMEMEFSDIGEPEVPIEPEEIFDTETEEKMRRNQIANEKEDLIREQTKGNPELAAELIKIWLKEDE